MLKKKNSKILLSFVFIANWYEEEVKRLLDKSGDQCSYHNNHKIKGIFALTK